MSVQTEAAATSLLPDLLDVLVCPETKLPLSLCTADEAAHRMGGALQVREAESTTPFGVTPTILLRDDGLAAYPVVDGVPILLVPEMITTRSNRRRFDLRDPRYAEAYEEMTFYNRVAAEEAEQVLESEGFQRTIRPLMQASDEDLASFPHPRHLWLDATYDCAAQWDAYRHIAPIRDQRVLQLGGMGLHAVKFLLGGAAEAWVMTPMLGEIVHSIALARAAGVADRLRCVVAVAEELPFASETFDVIYSGGCVHHMVTSIALPEAAHVLRKGGRFGAMDPWRAPLYAVGTKLLGKREPDVYCRPLTKARVAPLHDAFREARIIQHGTLTRYPLLALDKFGLSSTLDTVWRFNRADDTLCSLVPGLRSMGSSVALLGTK